MDQMDTLAAINAGRAPAEGDEGPPGRRRLALCFDGTWNSLDSQTNVSRLFRSIATVSTGCPDQLSFYDAGVGTTRGERLRGGAFGWGLDDNVLDGYCWLVNTYRRGEAAPDDDDPDGEPFDRGDAIYLFGFSRGAFTARSLAGLVNRVGLIDRACLGGKPVTPKTPEVRRAWKLYQDLKPEPGTSGRDMPECRAFRAECGFAVKIAMIGVWDTVGALGVPKLSAALGRTYAFHDTSLGRVVETAYHAMAIDEQRKDYAVALWTRPAGRLWVREIEQRWFPGAHANVGGGYAGDLLNEPPLLWMAQKAAAQGLRFDSRGQCVARAPAEFALDGSEYLSPVRDSYGEFAHGLYRLVSRRFSRPMMIDDDGSETDSVRKQERGMGIGQTIDPTAWLKWDADSCYRPVNLARAGRGGGPVGSEGNGL